MYHSTSICSENLRCHPDTSSPNYKKHVLSNSSCRRLRESTVLVHTYLPTLKTNPLYTSVEMCKMGFLAKLPDNPLYTKLSPDNSLYTPTLHINIIIVVAAKKPSTPCTPFFNMLTPTLNSLCSPPPPVCGAT